MSSILESRELFKKLKDNGLDLGDDSEVTGISINIEPQSFVKVTVTRFIRPEDGDCIVKSLNNYELSEVKG